MQEFIPSEKFADHLMGIVDDILSMTHINDTPVARTVVYLIVVIVLAVVSGMIVQGLLVAFFRRFFDKKFKDFSNELNDNKVLSRCGRVIPPLVLLTLIPFAFNSEHKGTHLIIITTVIYTVVMFVIAINSVLSLIWIHYNTHHNDKGLPLKGILDISRGGMWIVAVIVVISIRG